MRRRVIAHGGFANRGVDYGIHFLSNANLLLGNDLMCAHALYWVIASGHLGDDGVVIIGIEPSAIANLASGFGVEGCVIEDDLALVADGELLNALTVVDDDCEHFAAFGMRAVVAFEVGFRKLLVRRIGSLFGCAFPGGASASLFGLQRPFKPFRVKENTSVTGRVFDEIAWKSMGRKQLKGLFSQKEGFRPPVVRLEITTRIRPGMKKSHGGGD